MSSGAREWVFEYSSSKGVARLVLHSVADRIADDKCVAWASLSDLCQRTNASRTAVREALAALGKSGELETLDHLEGPKRASVYRLPRTAAWLAKVAEARRTDPEEYVDPPKASDPVPALGEEDEKDLRRYGIRPPATESDPSTCRNPTPARYGFRPPEP